MAKNNYPRPHKRYNRRAWEIYWNWNKRRYFIYPGYSDPEDEDLVEAELRNIAAALASPEPVFPDKYAGASAVVAYLGDRYDKKVKPKINFDYDALLKIYEAEIKLTFNPKWFAGVMNHLGKLREFCAFDELTPAGAKAFLVRFLAQGKKPGTHNRALMACTRFYKWLVHGEYLTANPFQGIKQLKELKGDEDIIYCTREERERIIAMAKASEWPDWMAVPIAFYTGMRKEEIARMEWSDVMMKEQRIVVPLTKTKKRRVLPMTDSLRELLESVLEARRKGFVVEMPEGFERTFRLENLHRKIRKLNNGVGKWKDKAKNKTDAERGQMPIPEERIGWNAWRHTFGSLLAQAGVSLDKISAWMGNTPDVCRRHYAQFMPRDRHDEDIEKL